MTRSLIVNADDLGWSRSVNRGILEAHRHGIVTSASLMANMPGTEDAFREASRCPSLGVGVHLNVTRGKALLPPGAIPTLVDGEGRFRRGPAALVRDLWLGRVSRRDVELEWESQVARVVDAGLRPTHLDSEKNLHAFPGFVAALARVSRRFGIHAIRRVTFERIDLRSLGRRGSYRMLILGAGTALGLASFRAGRHSAWRSPARTAGLCQVGHLDAAELLRLLARLPPGPTELMVHPGYVDDECRAISAALASDVYVDRHRENELRALTDERVLALCGEASIRLIHQGSLHHGDAASVGEA